MITISFKHQQSNERCLYVQSGSTDARSSVFSCDGSKLGLEIRKVLSTVKLFICTLLLLCGFVIGEAQGSATASGGFVAVTEFNNQNGTNAPALDPFRPYRLLSQMQVSGDSPVDGYLISPGPTPRRWRYARIENNGLWIGVDFDRLASLTNTFSAGLYGVEIETKTAGQIVASASLEPMAFPAAPRILAGDKTAWVGSRLYLTAPAEGGTIEWQPAGAGVDEIFVAIQGTDFTVTLPPTQTNYTVPANILEQLPFEEPVSCLVQFNAPGGSTATTVWLWKPQLEQRSFFAVARGRTFVQTSNATPAPWTPADAALFDSEFGPFNLAISGSRPGVVSGPGGKSYALTFASPGASLHQSGPYASQSSMDADYPDGTYLFGSQAATLGPSPYPNKGAAIKLLTVNGKPPRWLNDKLLLDAKIDNTLVWSAFQPVRGMPFATRGLITFSTGYVTEYSTRATDVVEAGLTGRARPFNRYRFPKGSLNTDRDHYIYIRYFLASFADLTAMAAAGAATTTYISVLPEP